LAAAITLPLSIDSSLALRPDPADAERRFERGATAERQEFAGVLARAQGSALPGSPETTLVPATRTRLSTPEAKSALRGAWEHEFGHPPSEKTLAILVGQWAHETGSGRAMLNYNFGGIKGTGPSGQSALYQTREGWGSTEVRVQDRFRAYGSAAEGANDYVSLLARRYPDAVQSAERGDPVGFVQALKARGYFTGNEAAYIKSVTSLSNQALAAGVGAMDEQAGDAATPIPFSAEAALARQRPPAELALANAAAEPRQRTVSREGASLAQFESSIFADEVTRAALLISALGIVRKDEERG
jgi:hypothetical protein